MNPLLVRMYGAARTGLSTLALVALAGCWFSPYRIEIQQGNYVSQEAMSQVKPGMNKEQVRAILGTPLINDLFHADRWDYVFRRSAANSTTVEARKATLYFEGEILKRVESDLMPPDPFRGTPRTGERK